MANKQLEFDEHARRSMERGVNILADFLKVMLAGQLRSRLTLQTINVINKISGSLLILFGILLFYGTYYL